MYRSFYKLREKPFQLNTDPRYLWLGRQHVDIITALKYKVVECGGLVVLTGDVGTGKTTLINALLDSLGDNIAVAVIPDPGFEPLEFFRFIANAFHLNDDFDSKAGFMSRFSRFLQESQQSGRMVLLAVDEAQHAGHAVLEELRHFLNLEQDRKRLLTLLLAGQNEFNDMLLQEQSRSLRQRITFHHHLEPLSQYETGEYIRHRLRTAGTTEEIFKAEALRELYHFSQGYPRLINIVCDLALLTGYSREQKTVDLNTIRDCVGKLRLLDRPALARRSRLPFTQSVKTEALQDSRRGLSTPKMTYVLLSIIVLMVAVGVYYAAVASFRHGAAQVSDVVKTLRNPSQDLPSASAPAPGGLKSSDSVLPGSNRPADLLRVSPPSDRKALRSGTLRDQSGLGLNQRQPDSAGTPFTGNPTRNSSSGPDAVHQSSEDSLADRSMQPHTLADSGGPAGKSRSVRAETEVMPPAAGILPLKILPLPLKEAAAIDLLRVQTGSSMMQQVRHTNPSGKAPAEMPDVISAKKKAPLSTKQTFTEMLLQEIDAMQNQKASEKDRPAAAMGINKESTQKKTDTVPSGMEPSRQDLPSSGPEALIDRVLKSRSR